MFLRLRIIYEFYATVKISHLLFSGSLMMYPKEILGIRHHLPEPPLSIFVMMHLILCFFPFLIDVLHLTEFLIHFMPL